MGANSGYSVVWLILVYLIGMYIRKWGIFHKWSSIKLWIAFIVNALLVLASKLVIEQLTEHILGYPYGGKLLVGYMSPFILISAVYLLLIFARVKIKWLTIIEKISSLAFSAYLIHSTPVIMKYVFAGKFKALANLPVTLEALLIPLCAIAIFILCCLVDLIRDWLFRVVRVKKILRLIEDKLLGNIW